MRVNKMTTSRKQTQQGATQDTQRAEQQARAQSGFPVTGREGDSDVYCNHDD